jgi:hypothetical protein
MPVANPALHERKRRRLIRSSCAHDPVGLAEPLYQLRRRDQVVVPSAWTGEPRTADPRPGRYRLRARSGRRRCAADGHAVSEISGLTDQAAAAAQAVRESMRQVGLAAAALALPEPTAG